MNPNTDRPGLSRLARLAVLVIPLAAAARLEHADLDENSAAILAFQRARIADGDRGRHGIGSALRPPARRPHVTHGQAKAGGWWQRLFGAGTHGTSTLGKSMRSSTIRE